MTDRKRNRILRKVNKLADSMRACSDEQLSGMTGEFRQRIRQGETPERLLPQAFAAVREAAYRTIGQYPYDVQVLAGIAMHYGRIVDMKTGEGKTLAAVLPAYLNALTGRSVILATTNDYLARRDAEIMGKVYSYMGLSVAVGVPDEPEKPLNHEEKKKRYQADVVYTTYPALAFDYLTDNLSLKRSMRCLRDFYYLIIDEADAMLLDAAQTPLVISGAPREQAMLYKSANYFVEALETEKDYRYDEDWRQCWLTEEGRKKACSFYRIEQLYAPENYEIIRHIQLALQAHTLYQKEKHYVVQNAKVKLLDLRSGRIMENTKLRGGIHQALEAKENVKISLETRAIASITYQEFMMLFPKIAGMSGTAMADAKEIRKIYGLKVTAIPTNRPCIRKDLPGEFFATQQEKLERVMEIVQQCHDMQRPVLLVVDSIGQTELYSEQLLRAGIAHNVLNAYHEAKEAQIIAEAGRAGAVTVATCMAGRGTDIPIDETARARGGLMVLVAERMESNRLEIQARGRSGRQGDPGESRLLASLDDTVVKEYGSERAAVMREMDDPAPSELRRETLIAQRRSEAYAVQSRDITIEFNRNLQSQRELLYALRHRVQTEDEENVRLLRRWTEEMTDEFLKSCDGSISTLKRFIQDNICYDLRNAGELVNSDGPKQARQILRQVVQHCTQEKIRLMADDEEVRTLCRLSILNAIDEAWVEEVDYLEQLRNVISDRSSAQRNPTYEYTREAHESYDRMARRIRNEAVRNFFLGDILKDDKGNKILLLP